MLAKKIQIVPVVRGQERVGTEERSMNLMPDGVGDNEQHGHKEKKLERKGSSFPARPSPSSRHVP